jgi:hypothetical protein
MGVFHPDLVGIQVRVLQRLGSEHVMVVYGMNGMDEVSLSGETLVGELKDGEVREYTVHPSDFGLPVYDSRALRWPTRKSRCSASSARWPTRTARCATSCCSMPARRCTRGRGLERGRRRAPRARGGGLGRGRGAAQPDSWPSNQFRPGRAEDDVRHPAAHRRRQAPGGHGAALSRRNGGAAQRSAGAARRPAWLRGVAAKPCRSAGARR